MSILCGIKSNHCTRTFRDQDVCCGVFSDNNADRLRIIARILTRSLKRARLKMEVKNKFVLNNAKILY